MLDSIIPKEQKCNNTEVKYGVYQYLVKKLIRRKHKNSIKIADSVQLSLHMRDHEVGLIAWLNISFSGNPNEKEGETYTVLIIDT
jgi:hypothetical protein